MVRCWCTCKAGSRVGVFVWHRAGPGLQSPFAVQDTSEAELEAIDRCVLTLSFTMHSWPVKNLYSGPRKVNKVISVLNLKMHSRDWIQYPCT